MSLSSPCYIELCIYAAHDNLGCSCGKHLKRYFHLNVQFDSEIQMRSFEIKSWRGIYEEIETVLSDNWEIIDNYNMVELVNIYEKKPEKIDIVITWK